MIGAASPIRYVLYVIKENRTYDQVLGDLGRGNGDLGSRGGYGKQQRAACPVGYHRAPMSGHLDSVPAVPIRELARAAVERAWARAITAGVLPALAAGDTPPRIEIERPAKPGTLKLREALYYVLSLPVSTVIVGCDSVAQVGGVGMRAACSSRLVIDLSTLRSMARASL